MIQSTPLPTLDAFVPPLAPLVLLAFLGAGLLVFGSAVAGAIALAARRFPLARILGGLALAIAVLYGAALAGASLLSKDRTLAAGEKKYFCEMDCHLAYSIAGVLSPERTLRVVTVRTWFDPSTIASFRGDAPLTPNPRRVFLVDGAGRRFMASPGATLVWEEQHGRSIPLDRELRPGDSYSTTFVFEVPSGGGLRLFVGDPPGPENFLIGHENSPGHGKVFFELPG